MWFLTMEQHLMRRIERGETVRGVSLKLQEEERERRLDFVPEKSAIDTDNITVDSATKKMLQALNLQFEVSVNDATHNYRRRH